MAKSKSKTFEIQTEFHLLHDWFCSHIETEDREVVHTGPEPYLDVKVETTKKYVITIKEIYHE